jgi:hypothetical protein
VGETPREALRKSLDLIRHAEAFGYKRFWVAEHHNMTGIASAATSIVIGYLAGGTSTIRMGSGVIQLLDKRNDEIVYTCWLRKVIATGDVVYAGFYSVCQPPNYPDPCVKVVFPLPQGNTTVVLKAIAHPNGSLELSSAGRRFGDPGYYRVLEIDADTRKIRLIRALKESIHVYVDEQGTLRTDHIFRFWSLEMLRLHYKISPSVGASSQLN